MSKREYNTIRQMAICDLANPKYLQLLREYAGELAPPCVAEALMNLLSR
jgi:hypothetical protein